MISGKLGKKGFRIVDDRGTYQYHKFEAAMQYVTSWRRCLDIGAHVGLWSMHLVKKFDHVEAFEPVKDFAAIFPFNVDHDNFTLHDVAVGSEHGYAKMGYPEAFTGNCHVKKISDEEIEEDDTPRTYSVEMVTIDSFGFDDIDFMKIDVEGWELPVVQGAKETLLRNKPIIIIEQKGNEEKFHGRSKHEATRFLHDLGMKELHRVMAGDHIMGW